MSWVRRRERRITNFLTIMMNWPSSWRALRALYCMNSKVKRIWASKTQNSKVDLQFIKVRAESARSSWWISCITFCQGVHRRYFERVAASSLWRFRIVFGNNRRRLSLRTSWQIQSPRIIPSSHLPTSRKTAIYLGISADIWQSRHTLGLLYGFLFLLSSSFGTQDICFCGSFSHGFQNYLAHVLV